MANQQTPLPTPTSLITLKCFGNGTGTFQGHLCPCETTAEVDAFVDLLLENKKLAAATHNIMAFRIDCRGGVWLQDADDDGEAAAGGRLLHLLQMAGARNVAVVVSRWFGGILLGADRFKLINNCARDLLAEHGYVVAAASGKRAGTNSDRGS